MGSNYCLSSKKTASALKASDFLLKLQERLGNGFECFNALDSLGNLSLILGSGLWEEHFNLLLRLVKITLSTSGRRGKLNYLVMTHPSTGDLGDFTVVERQSGKNMCQGGKPDTVKFHSSYIGMNVCDSAYENGCVVNGMCAIAAE